MRALIGELAASKIREVADAAIGRDDVLAFWFGESDEVTPQPVRDAAIASIDAGETFYAPNLGLPALRDAVAGYMGTLHGPVDAARIAITSSGVSALMLAAQALCGAGDEVVAVTPDEVTATRSTSIVPCRPPVYPAIAWRSSGRPRLCE